METETSVCPSAECSTMCRRSRWRKMKEEEEHRSTPQPVGIRRKRVDLTKEADGVEFHGWVEVVTEPFGVGSSVTFVRKMVKDGTEQ